MNHNFDIDLAKEYGVDIAIVINNLAFWIQKNKANGKHIHEGKVWTYNSTKAFSKIFPYWTENQMRRILSNMEEKGIIETGNYNQMQYDRTKWYAFTDAFLQNHKCICEFTQMDSCKPTNGFVQTNEPIPDNKPFHKPVEKPDTIAQAFIAFWEAYPRKKSRGQAEKAWLKVSPSLYPIIMTSLEKHKQSADWLKEGGQFIPHPATWLNAKGWEDEIEEKPVETSDSKLDDMFAEWQKEITK